MKPTLTVTENLAFWRDFCGDARILRVEEALETVGLGGDRPSALTAISRPARRRRAAIARLLVSRRPVWLLDEPTAGLDAEFGAAVFGADGGPSCRRRDRSWRRRICRSGLAGAAELRMGECMALHAGAAPTRPPLSCRTSPPQGGRLAGVAFRQSSCEASVANLPPCGGDGRQDRGGYVERNLSSATAIGRVAMLALYLRDLRLAIRAGGGALTGVLFFLAVVATIPFARRPRPQPARPHRPGDPVDRRAARLAARPRPAVPGRPRGRLARPAGAAGRPPHAGADGAGEMPGALDGERAAAGDRRRRCSG